MLPILAVQDQIVTHLSRGNRLVLAAPTGSGKTTQTPQILLRRALVGRQILVLQPRRLATRMVAQRVAREMGSPVGQLVGYQTRNDSQVSDQTRIRFITDGLFIRLLHQFPNLDQVDAVVVDEFHERTLAADLAAGLVCKLQERQRPDLKLVIMSATLDAAAVAERLGCAKVEATDRLHPIDIRYAGGSEPVWDRATGALAALLGTGETGDVLVFMPGTYEIRRTIEAMQRSLRRPPGTEPLAYFPLHGRLPPREQDAAVAPHPQRKVIVATNVAETSITIEGVRHVIDSGLARVHRFDPNRGIDVLLVEPVSQASTQQRAGRAGRTEPGTCTRLWSPLEQEARPAQSTPEIARLDLADTVLQLAALTVPVDEVPWLEPPTDLAVEKARALLNGLGAIGEDGQLTEVGASMAKLPMHPRLSRLLVEASRRKCLERASVWAALIGERSVVHGTSEPAGRAAAPPDPSAGDRISDLEELERLFTIARELQFTSPACQHAGVSATAAREVDATSRLYLQRARAAGLTTGSAATVSVGGTADLVKCLLVAFFDRVATRRDTGNLLCAMVGQRRVELDPASLTRACPIVVAVEIRETEAVAKGKGGKGVASSSVRTVLSMASGVEPEWLEEVHPRRVNVASETAWNGGDQAVKQHRLHQYDGLTFRREKLSQVDPMAAEEILVSRIEQGEIALDRWDREVDEWMNRTRLLSRLFPERDLILYDELEVRLLRLEIVAGATRSSHLRKRDCLPHVQNALDWKSQQFVRQMAPTRLPLPSGHGLRIEYFVAEPPRGRARIQDLYGLRTTPSIAGGRQPLLLEILGPNFRPVQVTDDLSGFWRTTYPEVKKDLQRRYPKHEWR